VLHRAISLNPNCAQAWWMLASVSATLCRPGQAIEQIQRAIRLSPLDPNGYSFKWVMAHALMLAGRYEEAMEWVDRALHERPNSHVGARLKTALCGYLGRTTEARDWVGRLLEQNPGMSITGYKAHAGKNRPPEQIAVWEEGFRRAGLPED
jgi:tetratricopeptide (TPR) repeat protein